MKTNKLIGFFDVRVYKKDLDRDKRPIKGQSDNITFTVASDAPIEGLKEYMVCKPKHTDSGDVNRYYLQFKIGGNCRWFDGNGQPTEQPLYSNLDGKRYEVIIDFNHKDKNPNNPLAPSGCWVNAIMYREMPSNPFEGMALGDTPINVTSNADEAHPNTETTSTNLSQEATPEEEDLPF